MLCSLVRNSELMQQQLRMVFPKISVMDVSPNDVRWTVDAQLHTAIYGNAMTATPVSKIDQHTYAPLEFWTPTHNANKRNVIFLDEVCDFNDDDDMTKELYHLLSEAHENLQKELDIISHNKRDVSFSDECHAFGGDDDVAEELQHFLAVQEDLQKELDIISYIKHNVSFSDEFYAFNDDDDMAKELHRLSAVQEDLQKDLEIISHMYCLHVISEVQENIGISKGATPAKIKTKKQERLLIFEENRNKVECNNYHQEQRSLSNCINDVLVSNEVLSEDEVESEGWRLHTPPCMRRTKKQKQEQLSIFEESRNKVECNNYHQEQRSISDSINYALVLNATLLPDDKAKSDDWRLHTPLWIRNQTSNTEFIFTENSQNNSSFLMDGHMHSVDRPMISDNIHQAGFDRKLTSSNQIAVFPRVAASGQECSNVGVPNEGTDSVGVHMSTDEIDLTCMEMSLSQIDMMVPNNEKETIVLQDLQLSAADELRVRGHGSLNCPEISSETALGKELCSEETNRTDSMSPCSQNASQEMKVPFAQDDAGKTWFNQGIEAYKGYLEMEIMLMKAKLTSKPKRLKSHVHTLDLHRCLRDTLERNTKLHAEVSDISYEGASLASELKSKYDSVRRLNRLSERTIPELAKAQEASCELKMRLMCASSERDQLLAQLTAVDSESTGNTNGDSMRKQKPGEGSKFIKRIWKWKSRR